MRIRNLNDLLRVMDTVGVGGELNITGYDARTRRRIKYEATVLLDSFV